MIVLVVVFFGIDDGCVVRAIIVAIATVVAAVVVVSVVNDN